MERDDKLSPDLVWQADGHLTEIALTALADGEDAILTEDALAHAAGCEACSATLGQAALLSLRVAEALREAPRAAEPAAEPAQPASAPLPVAAIVAALVVAALGAAPGLVAGAGRLPESWRELCRALVVVLRTGRAVAESGALGAHGWSAALPWASAALLIVLGLAVARASEKQLSLGGGT